MRHTEVLCSIPSEYSNKYCVTQLITKKAALRILDIKHKHDNDMMKC